MLGLVTGIQSAACAIAAAQAEQYAEQAFYQHIATLPEEMRAGAIQAHQKRREQLRRERIEERRHQELCAAIRSARLSGFGLFW